MLESVWVQINMSSGQQWVLVEMVQAFYEVSSRVSPAGGGTGTPARGRCLGGADFGVWVTSYPNISSLSTF